MTGTGGEYVLVENVRQALAKGGDLARALRADFERAKRYERALAAIRDSTLTGVDFGDWVQAAVEDLLEGGEAE